jgi:two-component system, sensor histidine kinase and response regulator
MAHDVAGPIDEQVLERYRVLQEEGDPDLVVELIEVFEADLPSRLDGLREAIGDGAADPIRKAAHALKGSAAAIGAVALASLAAELEGEAREGRTRGAADYLSALDARGHEAIQALHRLRARSGEQAAKRATS